MTPTPAAIAAPEHMGDDHALAAFRRSRSAMDRATRAVGTPSAAAAQDLGAELRSSVLLLGSFLLPILLLVLAAGLG